MRNRSSDSDITVEFRVGAIPLAKAVEILEKTEIPGSNLAQIARAIFELATESLPLLLKFKSREFNSKLEAVEYLKSRGVTSTQFDDRYSRQLTMSLAKESMRETSKEIKEIYSRREEAEKILRIVEEAPELTKDIEALRKIII